MMTGLSRAEIHIHKRIDVIGIFFGIDPQVFVQVLFTRSNEMIGTFFGVGRQPGQADRSWVSFEDGRTTASTLQREGNGTILLLMPLAARWRFG